MVDTAALKHNYEELRKLLPGSTLVMAVVKANAYGHGMVEVARALDGAGADSFGVATTEEGMELRPALRPKLNDGSVTKPIVVLGGVYDGPVGEFFDFELTPVVTDITSAGRINEEAVKRGLKKKVHVKVDTGMSRLGLLENEIKPFFNALRDLEGIEVEAMMSHFTCSETCSETYSKTCSEDEGGEVAQRQVEALKRAAETAKGFGIDAPLLHMANSAAVVSIKDSHMDMVRPGLMLYGSYPHERLRTDIELKPVMTLKTRIVQLKSVPKGTPVSYGGAFITERDSLIATLPIGYGDGLDRGLYRSGGEVLVSGKRAPIVGVVCMDLTMVDVTGIPGVGEGSEVVVIGSQGGGSQSGACSTDTITAEEMAAKLGTVPYEIFCNISARVPRVYI